MAATFERACDVNASLSGTIRLRPARIGFLVRPSDTESVRRAMRASTCLWGGRYNPLIPVARALPVPWREKHSTTTARDTARGYLWFFEPDVLVEMEPGIAQRLGIDLGAIRVMEEGDLFDHDRRRQLPDVTAGLSILDAYDDLYRREYQFVKRKPRRALVFSENAHPMVDAWLGGFPSDIQLSPFRDIYRDTFDAEEVRLDPECWRRIVEEGALTPLLVTRHDLECVHSPSLSPRLFIFDSSSPYDLIDLWNIRQFRREVVPVPIEWAYELEDLVARIISDQHRQIPGHPQGTLGRTVVEYGRSVSKADATALSNTIFSKLEPASWVQSFNYERIWSQARSSIISEPERVRVEAKTSYIDLPVVDEGGPTVQYKSLSPDFAQDFGPGDFRWVNVLAMRDFSQRHEYALAVPADISPEQLRKFRWAEPILSSREGLVLPQLFRGTTVSVRLQSGREAIIEWLGSKGVKAEGSDPGRIAERLLISLGGIGTSRILAEPNILQLLNSMAKNTRKSSSGTIDEVPDRTKSVSHWKRELGTANSRRRSRPLSIDDYVAAGAVQLGLAITCAHCTYRNWYGLGDLDETVRCARCLEDFAFPQGTLRHSNSPWHLRVKGPFTVPDYAQGAYSTVLALRVFSHALGGAINSSLSYSTNLNLPEMNDEIDFALWYQHARSRRESSEASFVVGEAKSFSSEAFEEKDIETLRAFAKRVPGTYLALACLKEELSQDEAALAADLAAWGRDPLPGGRMRAPVIVLTATEMFADTYVRTAWRDSGGQRADLQSHAYVNMSELHQLAELTQVVYLGMNSFGE